jgi:ergothioneine biosynthesis protein EgtB
MNDPRLRHAIDLSEGGSVPAARPEDLRSRFSRVRADTFNLAKPLSEEDCCVQSMPDASPVKWHLAHTTWFFETFVLERYERAFEPFLPAFRVLFNSYYNGVGEKHPRAQRGLLTRPALHEVMLYRRKVNERMQRLFERLGNNAAFCEMVELGLQHEQQHQELILTDLKHLLSLNPLQPAYRDEVDDCSSRAAALQWLAFDAGLVEIGNDGAQFCFDNETPRHKHYVDAYLLASRLVTNGEYLQFILNGGYRDPQWWLSEGWDWLRANNIAHPLYWQCDEQGWSEFTLAGRQRLDPSRPALHLSYYEADAYARWVGARLPTEAEWENAARRHVLQPVPDATTRLHARAAQGGGMQQAFGEAWQWTSSSYAPYPGYRWPQGAIGEYNGKFMVNQYVMRGSSCITPGGHSRFPYRNFFPAHARWQFSGIRLAKDGAGVEGADTRAARGS